MEIEAFQNLLVEWRSCLDDAPGRRFETLAIQWRYPGFDIH